MASTPNFQSQHTQSLPYAFFATNTAKASSTQVLNNQTAKDLRHQNKVTDTFDAPKVATPIQVLPLLPKELGELAKNPLKQAQLLQVLSTSPSVDEKGQIEWQHSQQIDDGTRRCHISKPPLDRVGIFRVFDDGIDTEQIFR